MDLSKVRGPRLSDAFRPGFAARWAAGRAAERCGLPFWGNGLKVARGAQAELHFMKKIPTGAEASNVLVGELAFLRQPVVAFVRLTPAVLLPAMTEVPVPTRSERQAPSLYLKITRQHEIGCRFGTPREHARFSHPRFLTSVIPSLAVAFKPIGQF